MCNFNFDLKKVLSDAMLPREGFNDINKSAHPCLSAKMRLQQDWEQVMERVRWRMFAAIFKKKKMWLEKKH